LLLRAVAGPAAILRLLPDEQNCGPGNPAPGRSGVLHHRRPWTVAHGDFHWWRQVYPRVLDSRRRHHYITGRSLLRATLPRRTKASQPLTASTWSPWST